MYSVITMEREEFINTFDARVDDQVRYVCLGQFDDGDDAELSTAVGYMYSNHHCTLCDGLCEYPCSLEEMLEHLLNKANSIVAAYR